MKVLSTSYQFIKPIDLDNGIITRGHIMGVQTTLVTIRGVEMEVEFSYSKPYKGSLEEPPEPEAWDLSSISIGGQEVSDILDNHVFSEIEEALDGEGRERMLEAQLAKYEAARDGN